MYEVRRMIPLFHEKRNLHSAKFSPCTNMISSATDMIMIEVKLRARFYELLSAHLNRLEEKFRDRHPCDHFFNNSSNAVGRIPCLIK